MEHCSDCTSSDCPHYRELVCTDERGREGREVVLHRQYLTVNDPRWGAGGWRA